MNKLLLLLLIVGIIFSQNISTDTISDNSINKDTLNWRFSVQLHRLDEVGNPDGLSPTLSIVKRNDEGNIKGLRGIRFNISGLFRLPNGYYSKNYFAPLKVNSLNFFWSWGTWLIYLPFLGGGIEYINTNGFYFSLEIEQNALLEYDVRTYHIGKYF